MRTLLIAMLCACAALVQTAAAEPQRAVLWEGVMHLGDNPLQFQNTPSAGLLMQVPGKLDPEKRGKLLVTSRDIQTLAGDGHLAELVAHYEDGEGPAREYVVQTFRLRGDSNNVDVDHTFELDPLKDLYQKPAYYSVRIKIDTQIRFGLWDDFLVKRIAIEQ